MPGGTGKRLSHNSIHHNQSAMVKVDRDREHRHGSHIKTRGDRLATSAKDSRHSGGAGFSHGESLSTYDGEINAHDILRRHKSAEPEAEKLKRFRTDPSYRTYHNATRLGIVMLILGVANIAIFTVLQMRRDSQAECSVVIPDKGTHLGSEWFYEITKKDCRGDLTKFQTVSKVYVYFGIENYAYHAAATFKLFSKGQMKGKLVDKDDLRVCYPYDTVTSSAKGKLLYPCGMHIWNIFNDKIMFSSKNPKENPTYLKMDESLYTLSRYQDQKRLQNPSEADVEKTKDNVYYWLVDTEAKLSAIPSTTPCSDSCESVHITHNTAQNVKLVYDMMDMKQSGKGVENGHFIQWMTPPPFKTFKKLYGILDGPINLPLYLKVNVAYDTSRFGGRKSVLIVAPSWPYGRLVSIQAIMGILAVLCIALAILLLLGRPADPTHSINLL